MQTLRSTVFILLPEQSHQSGQLLEVYAENSIDLIQNAATKEALREIFNQEKTAEEKNLIPVVAGLRHERLLYKEGKHVVKLLHKFTLKMSRWGIFQRISKYAWLENQRLFVASGHSDNCEGGSAQLGLAIAIILNSSNSPVRNAIATGTLASNFNTKDDIEVQAVGSVPEKLNLIIQACKAGKFSTITPLICFTPIHYMKAGEIFPVAELPQIAELAALDITVKPINWLSEAATILKARQARRVKQDLLFDLALAGLFSLILGIGFYQFRQYQQQEVLHQHQLWLKKPIEFEVVSGNQLTLKQPFLVCKQRNKPSTIMANLENNGIDYLLDLPNQDSGDFIIYLGINLRLKQSSADASSDQTPYYVAFIYLGEQSGYKIEAGTNKDIILTGENVLQMQLPIEHPVRNEKNSLVVVLQRTPIVAAELQAKLNQLFPNKKQKLDVLKASNDLIAEFPGHYVFPYKSIVGENPCTKL